MLTTQCHAAKNMIAARTVYLQSIPFSGGMLMHASASVLLHLCISAPFAFSPVVAHRAIFYTHISHLRRTSTTMMFAVQCYVVKTGMKVRK